MARLEWDFELQEYINPAEAAIKKERLKQAKILKEQEDARLRASKEYIAKQQEQARVRAEQEAQILKDKVEAERIEAEVRKELAAQQKQQMINDKVSKGQYKCGEPLDKIIYTRITKRTKLAWDAFVKREGADKSKKLREAIDKLMEMTPKQ